MLIGFDVPEGEILTRRRAARRCPSLVCARYLTAAATFEGARGEGRRGWLHLLAAYALAPHDEWIVEQVLYHQRECRCT